MRISVRSRKPWRIASCAAAVGIRCVKPSKAAVSPSFRFSATAWESGMNFAIAFLQDFRREHLAYVVRADKRESRA